LRQMAVISAGDGLAARNLLEWRLGNGSNVGA
jgi:hypothetical protein